MLEEAKRLLRPIVDYCDAGLSRMVVPIVRDGRLIGQLTACGGAPEAEEMDLFLIAKQAGITEAEAEALAAYTPVVSEDEVRTIASKTFAELNP
jgi:ligand-binding sensor protein